MGFNVGTIARVPLNVYDHIIFVVGETESSEHAKWVHKNFAELVNALPSKTALVTGTDDRVSEEVEELLSDWGNGWNKGNAIGAELFHFFGSCTTLVISRGDLKTTNKPIIVIPLAPDGVMEGTGLGNAELEEFMTRIFQSVYEAVKQDQLDELIASLGATELPLKPLKGGLKFTTLKRVNEVCHLKPSLFGIGLNINGIIDVWLKEHLPTR